MRDNEGGEWRDGICDSSALLSLCLKQKIGLCNFLCGLCVIWRWTGSGIFSGTMLAFAGLLWLNMVCMMAVTDFCTGFAFAAFLIMCMFVTARSYFISYYIS